MPAPPPPPPPAPSAPPTPCEVAALKACLDAHAGDRVKCQQEIAAFAACGGRPTQTPTPRPPAAE